MNRSNNIILLPCPFCGSKKHFKIASASIDKGTVYTVECTKCYASGPMSTAEEKAIAGWNREYNK